MKGGKNWTNDDTPAYDSSLFAPSCPTASQIQDTAVTQETIPPSNAAVAIKRLLAIPTANRNSSETEALIAHMEDELTYLSEA